MMKRLFFALSLVGMCLMAVPQTASAFNLFGGVDCSQAQAANSAVCQKQPDNPISGSGGLILNIANIIAYIAGIAAVIIIIIGALRLITSGSDTSKGGRVDADVENARRSIAGALIGIVVIIMGKILITYLVNRIK
ncbi:MAG TPA: hypothetical protein VH234_05125 [Candidatus Saccharimonadales bacterium]|jgi:amino acid transporter|nr:hypothetical protein [Candidatus Saccharimonadales bacterium]